MPAKATRGKARGPKRLSPRIAALVKSIRQQRAIGAKCYERAGDLQAELRGLVKVGQRLPLGDGLHAVLVDRFADGDKAFQPVMVSRHELQIQDEAGRVVRMRDRKKPAPLPRKRTPK